MYLTFKAQQNHYSLPDLSAIFRSSPKGSYILFTVDLLSTQYVLNWNCWLVGWFMFIIIFFLIQTYLRRIISHLWPVAFV